MKKLTNSVVNRTTQINNLCQTVNGPGHQIDPILLVLEKNKSLLGRYYYLFMLMAVSGCRVSEALNLTKNHISYKGNVLIKGLKGSKDRVVFYPQILEIVTYGHESTAYVFPYCNRFTAYRELKRLGIGKLKKGRTHRSVTHIFRDEFVKDVRTTQATERTTSDTIGHKSINSTEYYGKD